MLTDRLDTLIGPDRQSLVRQRQAFPMSDSTKRSMPDDLIRTIASGERVSLCDITRFGVDINASGANNPRTPLMAAAFAGNVDLIRAIAGSGGVVDHRGPHGSTALIEAAAEGHVDAVSALLELGADIDAPTPDGCTALMAAAAWGQCEVVGLLLARGAAIHLRDSRGGTALMIAEEKGELQAAALLRAAGGIS